MPHLGELMHLLLRWRTAPAGLVLQLHLDGTNGSTTFTDSSAFARAPSGTAGTPALDTAQAKWGASSCYFDGTDVIGYTNDVAFQLAAGDFTVECWCRPSASGNSWRGLVGFGNGSSGPCLYATMGFGTLRPTFYGSGSSILTHQTTMTPDTWNHVAACRKNGTVKVFLNGVQSTTSMTFTNTFPSSTVTVGASTFSGAGEGFTGHIDDVRIVKGLALYDADFTPPTEAFPDP